MDETGTNEINLAEVGECRSPAEAAHTLYRSVHQASLLFGGKAVHIMPGDHPEYAESHGGLWQGGPRQWADGYVVCEGAIGTTFTSNAAGGQAVLFTDLRLS